MGFAWTTLTGHTTTAEFFIHLNLTNLMDIFNVLICYVYVLAALFCVNAVWTALNAACVEVLGTSFQELLSSAYAEATLAAKLAPLKLFSTFAELTEGKVGASPRYFG